MKGSVLHRGLHGYVNLLLDIWHPAPRGAMVNVLLEMEKDWSLSLQSLGSANGNGNGRSGHGNKRPGESFLKFLEVQKFMVEHPKVFIVGSTISAPSQN